MKITTAYNHKRRLANKLRHAYLMAVYDRPSHRDLCATISQTVWSDPGFKRCPSWVVSSLMELRSILSEQIYDHLVWAFIGSDGTPRQLDCLSEDDRQAVFRGDIKGAHYWLKTDKRRQTLPDGSILETTMKTPTLASY